MTQDQDEASRRRIGISNERAKLLANALDRASTACVTVGILAPAAAFLYGVGAAPASSIVGGAFAWLGAAITLHLIARAVLGASDEFLGIFAFFVMPVIIVTIGGVAAWLHLRYSR